MTMTLTKFQYIFLISFFSRLWSSITSFSQFLAIKKHENQN
jgi:hypothetical protein